MATFILKLYSLVKLWKEYNAFGQTDFLDRSLKDSTYCGLEKDMEHHVTQDGINTEVTG